MFSRIKQLASIHQRAIISTTLDAMPNNHHAERAIEGRQSSYRRWPCRRLHITRKILWLRKRRAMTMMKYPPEANVDD